MTKILAIITRIPYSIWYLLFNTLFGIYCYIVACIKNIGNGRNIILLLLVFRTNHAIIEFLVTGEDLQKILKKYDTKRK